MVEASSLLSSAKVEPVSALGRRRHDRHLLAIRPGRHWLGMIIALLFAGSMWFYVQRILVPYQQADAA